MERFSLQPTERGFEYTSERKKEEKGEARDCSGEGDASAATGARRDGRGGRGGPGHGGGGSGGEVGEAAAGAALRRGAARRGVRRRAVAGAEGRRLLRLRVPPVAGGRRRRRASAGGVRQDHLPLLAQAGEDGSCGLSCSLAQTHRPVERLRLLAADSACAAALVCVYPCRLDYFEEGSMQYAILVLIGEASVMDDGIDASE